MCSLNVGLIGYGYAGQTFHAPLIRVTEGMQMVAVVWRVNLAERRATIWMRTVSRLGDDARHLIVAGTIYAGG